MPSSRFPRARSRTLRLLLRAGAAVVLVAGVVTGTVVVANARDAGAGSSPAHVTPTGSLTRSDGRFTLAVLPDTQMEVLDPADTRFTNRIQWLERNASSLDLRYITHTGDVVNWDTADHAQYAVTQAGVRALDAGTVPWSFSIGNHDTAATGPGGGARPGGDARIDQRVTTTFNSYYGVSHARALAGTYQAGRVDNSYSTFSAENTDWLVLNLELWPRTEVVQWAQGVVSSHPHHNVVVVTHAFLTGGRTGAVQQDNGGYGANSPQYVLDNLVLKYPNVRFVFSGHAGTWDRADLTGVSGNPVTVIQTTYHDRQTNPTRLVTIDVAHGSYRSTVYAPATNTTYHDGSASSRTAMAWVRPS